MPSYSNPSTLCINYGLWDFGEGGETMSFKLPNGMSAVDLYRVALAKGVAICPGDPFYEKERNVSTFRINYSNSSDEVIEKGIRILGEACAELIAKKGN